MPATELPLYRSFLKVLQKWPVDKVRPNRDLKQVLTKRIEETFQTEKINMVQVENEFKALEKLVNNEFKTKYPLSERILSPASNPKYYSGLMSSIGSDNSKSLLGKLMN